MMFEQYSVVSWIIMAVIIVALLVGAILLLVKFGGGKENNPKIMNTVQRAPGNGFQQVKIVLDDDAVKKNVERNLRD